jgi:hypothetical protein
MSADDEIRAAFADLRRRTRQDVDARASLDRLVRPPIRRFTPAVMAAVAVFVLVGGFALLRLLPGEVQEPPPVIDAPSESTGSVDTTVTTSAGSPETTESGPAVTEAEGPVSGSEGIEGLHRVNTDMVAADSDPFLNVRTEPDPGAAIVARLAPTYAGVRFAGETADPNGGGTWWLVELVDPVTPEQPTDDGSAPVGWVNAAFLEPLPDGLPVTTDEVAACGGDDAGAGGGGSDAQAVLSLRTATVADGCIRFVVGFGTSPGEVPVSPAESVPAFQEWQSNGPLTINFPETAAAWAGATEVPGGFVVREPDGSLSLVVTVANDGVRYSVVPERGALVIDVSVPSGAGSLPSDERVALTAPPVVGPGSVDITGISRPFEANLGVSVLDESGGPVEAVFSGSDFLGTVSTTGYAVTTTDWVEAWGRFAVRVDGLSPGRYTAVLDGLGGEGPADPFRYDFTVTEGGPAAEAPPPEANEVAASLTAFARGGDPTGLASQVLLGVGDEIVADRSAGELGERSAWDVEPVGGTFAERSGPFNALDLLASTSWYRVSDGPVPSCPAGPRSWPSLEGMSQVNIEPVGIDSCIEWFAVSVFLDDAGDVAGVVVDIGSP